MSRNVLLLAAMTALSTTLLAQSSGWPPTADHLTMPDLAGRCTGRTDKSAAGGRHDHGERQQCRRQRAVLRLGNVVAPTITLYKAKNAGAGPAVVVFPGGGYKILAIDLEGTEVCDWLNSAGVNCVLLKYRVPGTGPYPKSNAALQDAQRAMGLVRQHAAEWGIDPNRVGVLGFSAGGHLSAAISNLYDKKGSTTRLTRRTSSAVVPTFLWLCIPDTWR